METIKIDPQKLCGYSKYLWEKAFNEGYKEGYKIGFEKGYKEAYNKQVEKLQLTIYTNLKKENFGESFIRFVLGVSIRKFQEIKRLYNESIAGTERPLT